MKPENLSQFEETRKQLANARTVLASVWKANRSDGIWNEHVLHIESEAEKLVDRLEKEAAFMEISLGRKSVF